MNEYILQFLIRGHTVLTRGTHSRFGPEWQCVVGTKEAFGSCLSPTSTFYSLLCVDKICVLLFKS